MPDKVRSVDDMVADMERAVEEPEGNTSSAKHRQHVAQAIEKLISSQIIDGKVRYLKDGTGSKAASKTAPALLTVAAAVQEMVSEMSGMVNLLVNLRVLALEPVEIIPGIIDTTPVVITDNWHYCA